MVRGAAIAQWIHLCLPSCRHGFESQAHHLWFHQFIKKIVYCRKDENKQKEAEIGPYLKKGSIIVNYGSTVILTTNYLPL